MITVTGMMVRSCQVRYITRPKSRTMRVTRQLGLRPRFVILESSHARMLQRVVTIVANKKSFDTTQRQIHSNVRMRHVTVT
jgi:hypothetical protein